MRYLRRSTYSATCTAQATLPSKRPPLKTHATSPQRSLTTHLYWFTGLVPMSFNLLHIIAPKIFLQLIVKGKGLQIYVKADGKNIWVLGERERRPFHSHLKFYQNILTTIKTIRPKWSWKRKQKHIIFPRGTSGTGLAVAEGRVRWL